MDTLISNVTVVTMNERMDVLFGAYLGITEGKISYIEKTPPKDPPAAIVDGTGMVAIPGLINCHTHLATAVLRGCFDELSSREALEALLQKEAKMDSRCAKAAVTLAVAECLRFGITSVSDLYYYPEVTAQVLADAGLKGNIALSAYCFRDDSEEFDFETDEQCRELRRVAEKWNGYDQGRIRVDGGIYAEYTGNHHLWEALSRYCKDAGLSVQLHLSQTTEEVESCLDRTGLAPAELLACHGLLDVPATVCGGSALTQEEIAILGKKKATLVTMPLEDARAGRKAADFFPAVRAGCNGALGTGGAMDSGSLDMFETMRAAVYAQRQSAGNACAMPAGAVLTMATVCGAAAQGRAAQCGMLKVGMDADLALVDFSAPHLIPCHNVLNTLVFSAKGGDVAMTMVRGKILYQSGHFPTLDLKTAVEELTQYAIAKLFDAPQKEAL